MLQSVKDNLAGKGLNGIRVALLRNGKEGAWGLGLKRSAGTRGPEHPDLVRPAAAPTNGHSQTQLSACDTAHGCDCDGGEEATEGPWQLLTGP